MTSELLLMHRIESGDGTFDDHITLAQGLLSKGWAARMPTHWAEEAYSWTGYFSPILDEPKQNEVTMICQMSISRSNLIKTKSRASRSKGNARSLSQTAKESRFTKQPKQYSPLQIVERNPVDRLFEASEKAGCKEFKKLFLIKARELARKRCHNGNETYSYQSS